MKKLPPKPPAPPLTAETPLSERETAFVREYLIDLNGAAAARRVGYAAKTAKVTASKLLTKANLAAAVMAAMAARAERTGLTADRVLAELEQLAFSSIANYVVDIVNGKVTLADGAPPDAMKAVAGITHKRIPIGEHDHIDEVTLKLWDKPGMLRLAGQHLGIEGFRTRVELTGKDGKPIEIKPSEIDQLTDEQLRTRVLVLLERL